MIHNFVKEIRESRLMSKNELAKMRKTAGKISQPRSYR